MVILESCKGCGSAEFVVKSDKGYDFLTCSHCGATVALLSDNKPSPTSRDFVEPDSIRIMSSGVSYTGIPLHPSWYYMSTEQIIGT